MGVCDGKGVWSSGCGLAVSGTALVDCEKVWALAAQEISHLWSKC